VNITAKISISSFLIFSAGVIFWGGFNWSMALSNTERFCISCHEMEDNVYPEYQASRHYRNRTGVRATCPDCHVPKDWYHKFVRKIGASTELYHKMMGSIDTVEKFQAKRAKLAKQVWASMRATDSRECRNCHEFDHMALEQQSAKARNFHRLSVQWGKTCIDCHQGIAHHLPDFFDPDAAMDALHVLLEKDNIACQSCHEQMAKAPEGDAW